MHKDTIIITGETMLDEVYLFAKRYNDNDDLKNKFKKILVFCSNLDFQDTSLKEKNPELIFDFIDDKN